MAGRTKVAWAAELAEGTARFANWRRLSTGRFSWWPDGGPARTLAAHELQVLLSAGDPRNVNAPAATKSRSGHGRNGADDLSGAKHVSLQIAGLQPGASCPACGDGMLYELNPPGELIRFVGQAPVRATIYELQKLRCKQCGQSFTAEPPPEAGARKYDETVGGLIGGVAPRTCRRRCRCATRCRGTTPNSFRRSSPTAWRTPGDGKADCLAMGELPLA